MENLFMGLFVSGMMLAFIFSIVWVVQLLMKKSRTVSVTGLKISAILSLVGLSLSVGIDFTITFALLVGVIYFVFKRNKKPQDSSEKPKRTFWNIPFRSEPKAVAIAAAISLCITVWATVDFYRTADTITTDSPSAEVEIEEEIEEKTDEEAEQKAAEEAAAKEAEEKAAEEAAAKEAEEKAAEEAAAKEAEEKAAEEAAAKEAEQKAAEEAAAKEAEQKAAEEAAAKEAEQKAAEEAAAKEAEEKAAEEAAAEEQDTEEYVLNTNTRKFHHSWCSSANRIKPGNRSTCIGRDAAIAMGYTSCGQCNP